MIGECQFLEFRAWNHAIYLPAINSNYASALGAGLPMDRHLSGGIVPSDFAFWSGRSKAWSYPYILHSIGQYKVGSNPNNAITSRAPREGVLFGDSAGYQIGIGSLKGLAGLQPGMSGHDAADAWKQNAFVRQWIVDWLETYTNFAMTIDMPLWATLPQGAKSPFHRCSEEQLRSMTVENLKFIDRHRQGRTKWLNVIQGLDSEGMMNWWSAVNWFDCSGYSFSAKGVEKNGLTVLLETLLKMRDRNAFSAKRSWVHLLGCSTVPWAIVCTAIQRGLQHSVGIDAKVSFDSSSPLIQGSRYEKCVNVPALGGETSTWSFEEVEAPKSPLLVGSEEPLPFSSPIADRLNLGDLNVREGKYQHKQYDRYSHLILMNHNIWTYLATFEFANNMAFSKSRNLIPGKYWRCLEIVEELFRVENWHQLLLDEKELLDSFNGS